MRANAKTAKRMIQRSLRAISPVIAVLLMIVIAVAASLVAYAWVMGYIGFTTNRVGKAIQIQSIAKGGGGTDLLVYVQNVGQTALNLDPTGKSVVYVNDALMDCTLDAAHADGVLDAGETATLTIAGAGSLLDAKLSVKVQTTDGTFIEKTNFSGGAGGGGAVSNPQWRKSITVNHAKVSGSIDLSNFPVLVSWTTDSDLASHCSADGHDIYFSSDVAGTSVLPFEIENWDQSTGLLVAWVRTTVSPTADSVFYMIYGDQTIASKENPTGVWDSNYQGVWHLPNGATLSASDSTSNNNDGIITETVASTGKIDGAGSFDGTNDKIDYGDINALDGLTQLTVSAWIRPTDLSKGYQHFIAKRPTDASTGWGFQTTGTGASTGVLALIDGGTASYGSTGNLLTANSWAYVSFVYDGSQTGNANRLKIYVNGASQSLSFYGIIPPSIAANSLSVTTGYSSDPGDNYFKGNIDEARTSNIARSAAWIATEFNNQNDPATFFSIGAGTPV
jgi:FlaG/FlaF family flagellin (archaellin)